MIRSRRIQFVLPLVVFAACRCGPNTSRSREAATPAVTSMATRSVIPETPPTPASEVETPMPRDSQCPEELVRARRDGTKPNSYVEPTDLERRVLGDAIAKLVRGEEVGGLDAIGFEVVRSTTWPDVVIVREKGRLRGGGAYVVREHSSSSLVVQAPHTFFDEGTFPIACELFQRSHARALFINTTHRYKSSTKTGDGKYPSDVAHSPTSLFHAATEALVSAEKGIAVVQAHGFSTREVDARAVVSSGDKRGGAPWVAKAARSLEEVMGGKVLRFPEDTKELGATTNVQGAAVRRAGGRFLHVEMDDEMRRRLLGDAHLRSRALDAIVDAIGSGKK